MARPRTTTSGVAPPAVPRPFRRLLPLVPVLATLAPAPPSVWGPIRDCGDADEAPAILEVGDLRVGLRDRERVADRFLAFAAMSSLAYLGEADHCQEPSDIAPDRARFEQRLDAAGWSPGGPFLLRCESAKGLFLRIWAREPEPGSREIAVAFRGTDGPVDWKTNARWFRLSRDDQYAEARERMREVVAWFRERHPDARLSFVATGHSLGGGLAQHVLFDQPEAVRQAIVFHTTPVQGTEGVSRSKRKAACRCLPDASHSLEPRVVRLYESGEVLGYLRGFLRHEKHLRRHVQEVAFDFHSGDPFEQHSIRSFTNQLIAWSKADATGAGRWNAVRGSCSDELEAVYRKGCERWTFLRACPY